MYNIKDKELNLRELNDYLFSKTLSMFRYEGLPDTIPQQELEKILQKNGSCFVTEIDGKLYAFSGGKGGTPDEYYRPTTFNVSNPALKVFEQFDINEDGVLFKNDSLEMGILRLMNRYHTLMIENNISMDMASLNSRIITFLSASDDKTRESAERFIRKIIDGEISIIGNNAMFEGVKAHAAGASGATRITDLIEYHQYLKSTLYGELGINAPFNMKRERVNTEEVGQHEEALSIFVDNMKECRDDAINRINEKYGTEIVCNFSGVWEKKREETTLMGGATSDQATDSIAAEWEENSEESAEEIDDREDETMTINEFLEGADLWDLISQKGTFPFIDGTTNMLFKTMYGESPLFTSLEQNTADEVAMMIVVMYGDKWEDLISATSGIDFGAESTRKVTETTTTDEDTTDTGTGTQKTSAYNSETLVDDAGSETQETGQRDVTVDRELTESNFTIQSAYDALTSADKLSIIRVALDDAASFMKLDIY